MTTPANPVREIADRIRQFGRIEDVPEIRAALAAWRTQTRGTRAEIDAHNTYVRLVKAEQIRRGQRSATR
jgi:hypothetical protein